MGELLNLHQLAARFHLSPRWIKQQVKAGVIPHLRAGETLLFNASAVAAKLAAMAEGMPNTQHTEALAHATR